MKLIVFSDSHHANITDMLSIIDEEKPDAVLHLGDLTADVDDIRCVFPDLHVYNVRGNNDWNVENVKDSLVVHAGSANIFLTHGHLYGVRRNTRALEAAARQNGCNVALYGHTHEAEITRKKDMLIANPGSISMPYSSAPPSYLRLNIWKDQVEPELVYLERQKSYTHWFGSI